MATGRGLLVLVMATSACATAMPKPGESFAAVRDSNAAAAGLPTPYPSLAEAVTFDHGCPKERIRMIREAGGAADLDVCGLVRRYKRVAGPQPDYGSVTWLDVTSLYPSSSLPAPLPPAAP